MGRGQGTVVAVVGALALGVAGCAHQAGGPASLVGTHWLGQTVDGQAVPNYPPVTLAFDTPGKLSGQAVCNRYWATMGVAGEQIDVGPLSTTQNFCPPEQLNRESAYLQALAAARGFDVSEWTLTLSDANGRTRLTFTRLTQPL